MKPILILSIISLAMTSVNASAFEVLGLEFCSSGSSNTSSEPTSKGCWPTAHNDGGPTSVSNGNGVLPVVAIVVGIGAVVFTTVKVSNLGKLLAMEDYAAKNMNFLLADISRGKGDFLTGYANLYGCSGSQAVGAFSGMARREFLKLDASLISPQSLSKAMAEGMHDQTVWLTCATTT